MKVVGAGSVAAAVPSVALAENKESNSIEGELEQELFPEEFQELDYDLEGAAFAQDIDW